VKKRYLYLIFISLSVVVVLLIALIFKLQKTTSEVNIVITQDTGEEENMEILKSVQNYKDSWITKIKNTQDKKDYSYAVEIFHKEF